MCVHAWQSFGFFTTSQSLFVDMAAAVVIYGDYSNDDLLK